MRTANGKEVVVFGGTGKKKGRIPTRGAKAVGRLKDAY